MTEPTRERTWAEPWDRGRLGGLNNALNVVRSLNGNGHDEPEVEAGAELEPEESEELDEPAEEEDEG